MKAVGSNQVSKLVGVDFGLDFEQDLKPRVRFVDMIAERSIFFHRYFPQLWKLFFPPSGRLSLPMIANRLPDFKDFFPIPQYL